MSNFTLRPRPRGGRWPVAPAQLGFVLLVVAALMMGGAGPAYRLDLLPLGTAFDVLRLGAYVAVGAAALGLIAVLIATLCRRWKPAFAGLLVIAAVAAMLVGPWEMMHRAQRVPPIHDITTDTTNPPAFEALAEAREAAPNGVEYPGESFARRQRSAYPWVQPITLPLPLAEVRDAAEATAREMGWEIAAVEERHIEATATTRWFGFKDDVAIRLTPEDDGVRVDVRSASRLGQSDLGTNAGRIHDYLTALHARVE
ncbi:DUF1499 domain-containing protein [Billgrantia gudaonensis]|uniref:Stage III sporulation protein AC/AD protein family protein n=1 Tax=Billgrantia gudaonensis TaxID=376427 RepID=A0A1G9BCP8_9GAMM|nr:DUF1499 domain-containing protein [Halomonas gudaonensis]SDK36834.1 Stage III sporulation protein AC/AD protein family protein [Halomonas gudaonensis]